MYINPVGELLPAASCVCFAAPYQSLVIEEELGMDENFAEIFILTCPLCGQKWLKVLYEIESFTASGRWFMGAVTEEQAFVLKAENARRTLEDSSWYFYGGSYFGGQIGRASGKILLNP